MWEIHPLKGRGDRESWLSGFLLSSAFHGPLPGAALEARSHALGCDSRPCLSAWKCSARVATEMQLMIWEADEARRPRCVW